MPPRRTDLPDGFEDLLKLVATDHERNIQVIARLIAMRAGLFTLAGTLWTAAIGAGIATGVSGLFVTAAVVIVIIGGLDLVYSGHYQASRRQARRHEQVLNANYKRISRGNKPHDTTKLARVLATVELGQTSTLRNTPLRYLWRYWDLRSYVFVALVVAALGFAAVSLVLDHDNPDPLRVQAELNTVVEYEAEQGY